jgi:alpha-methylacyl-CoA racemase
MALSGVTVVDLTRYLPGPYCTRLLADLGASVIKIESAQGDPMRGFAWYDLLNHAKEIVTLDLLAPDGRDELHRLLARADVCVEGFKPGTAKALGVDGATLATRYPSLVHCSISGYGRRGPDADRAAHDINYQSDAGLLGAYAPRRVPPLLVADITGALHATIAILAALLQSPAARRSDATSGAALEISLLEAARSWMTFLPPPILRGEYACYNVYETSDARRVALGALEAKFWERFCRRVGRLEWVAMQFTDDAQPSLIHAVAELFRSRTAAEWSSDLTPADCCFSILLR